MVKKGEKKESAPKTPILIIPFKKGDYPRLEVFVDSYGSTVGIRELDDEGIPKALRRTVYGTNTPKGILRIVDESLMLEKMTKIRAAEYQPTLQGFLELVEEHRDFMKGLVEEDKL